jgi:hypothetical protein
MGEYMTVEDVLFAVVQGKDVWANATYRTDLVKQLRDTVVEWLREAEARASEFDHAERVERFRQLRVATEEAP